MTRANQSPITSSPTTRSSIGSARGRAQNLYREILEWRAIVAERKEKAKREAAEEREKAKRGKAKAEKA